MVWGLGCGFEFSVGFAAGVGYDFGGCGLSVGLECSRFVGFGWVPVDFAGSGGLI